MPFARPSLADLITRIGGDLLGRLAILGPTLRRAMADVVSKVWGGGLHELYGFVEWASRQVIGNTADSDVMLQRAAMYGITPTAAAFAAGNVTVTGTNGSVIDTTAVLQLDSAALYAVTTGATIASGTATIVVTALVAGAAGNLDVGTALSFQSPIGGVATATVATGGPNGDGIAGGADQQTPADVLARYLLRLRTPPRGGAAPDYIAWTLAAPGGGATRAWAFPGENGLGTVVVRFVDDNATPIIPTGGQVSAVQTYLNAQRPVTATVTAVAPTSLSVAFTIHLVRDNSSTRAAVTAGLADTFARLAQPGDGAGKGTVPLSQIRTAIGIADGVTDYTLTVPSADVVPGTGQMPTVGTITWV